MKIHDNRGVLYPGRLPSFQRYLPPEDLSEIIRWFWIPQWNLPPGEISHQKILPFPASNLVVEPSNVVLVGPTTRLSIRELSGQGWAVGALLRPAGLSLLCQQPSCIKDKQLPVPAPELHRSITAVMPENYRAAVDSYTNWLRELGYPIAAALQANRMEELIAADRDITRVEHLARSVHMSVRSVQRLAKKYVGVSPLAIIRRYRLQEAAERLRNNPTVSIAEVAADLGYADHSHLNADFRHVLGFTPGEYQKTEH